MSGENGFREKLGEAAATIRSLDERFRDRQIEARDESKAVRAELRTIKEEQRAEWSTLNRRMDAAEKEGIKLAVQMSDVTARIGALQAPVEELVAMKRRVVAFVALGASVFAVLWPLTEPVRSWVVNRLFGTN